MGFKGNQQLTRSKSIPVNRGHFKPQFIQFVVFSILKQTITVMRKYFYTALFSVLLLDLSAQVNPKIQTKIDAMAKEVEPKVIEWRRHFHQYPELSNREFKTGAKVAEHLKSLGIEVQTGVAKTGVVGILKGGKPGPVIALRADMDGRYR